MAYSWSRKPTADYTTDPNYIVGLGKEVTFKGVNATTGTGSRPIELTSADQIKSGIQAMVSLFGWTTSTSMSASGIGIRKSQEVLRTGA